MAFKNNLSEKKLAELFYSTDGFMVQNLGGQLNYI